MALEFDPYAKVHPLEVADTTTRFWDLYDILAGISKPTNNTFTADFSPTAWYLPDVQFGLLTYLISFPTYVALQFLLLLVSIPAITFITIFAQHVKHINRSPIPWWKHLLLALLKPVVGSLGVIGLIEGLLVAAPLYFVTQVALFTINKFLIPALAITTAVLFWPVLEGFNMLVNYFNTPSPPPEPTFPTTTAHYGRAGLSLEQSTDLSSIPAQAPAVVPTSSTSTQLNPIMDDHSNNAFALTKI